MASIERLLPKAGLSNQLLLRETSRFSSTQIGSLHRDRKDEFLLAHLACYVLLQKDCKDVQAALLAATGMAFPRRIIGDHWRDVIAALHFGVATQEARQLLLRGPIQASLAKGDAASLSELASTHPDGFWTVLEDSVPAGGEDWGSPFACRPIEGSRCPSSQPGI